MILITDRAHHDTINSWLSKKYGVFVNQSPAAILGVIDNDGVLRGAFTVTSHNDTTAEMSVFGKTSNDTWKQFFFLVFVEWGIERLEIRTAKTNRTVKRAAPKFGFAFEGVAKAYYGRGSDALVFGMQPHQCRWIKDEPLQTAESARAA